MKQREKIIIMKFWSNEIYRKQKDSLRTSDKLSIMRFLNRKAKTKVMDTGQFKVGLASLKKLLR